MDQFAVVCAAHGEGGRAAAVGEGEDGVLRAQRQHGIDVQRRLAALSAEDEGIYALLLSVLPDCPDSRRGWRYQNLP